MKDIYGKEISQSPYTKNDTMKMLGRNCYLKVFDRKVFSELDDILNARPFSYTKDTAMGIFMLGYIYGKRAERARKKRGV